MKWFLALVAFLLIGGLPAYASEAASQENSELSIKNELLTFMEGIEPTLTPKFVSNMAIELCGIIQNGTIIVGYSIPEALERNLLRFSGLTKDDPNYELKLATFWNHYSVRMICPPMGGRYPNQHIYTRAVEMGLHRAALENYFFKDIVAFPIDVNNLYILSDGSFATIMDYIDSALELDDAEDRYNVDELLDMQDALVQDFGALRAQDFREPRSNQMSPSELTKRGERAKSMRKKYDVD